MHSPAPRREHETAAPRKHILAGGQNVARHPAPTGRRSGLPMAVLALVFVVVSIAPLAGAQSASAGMLVGVIASRTAGASNPGVAQWLLASDAATRLRNTGIFGVSISLDIQDDNSSPEQARLLTQQLVDDGALLIICCTTPLATREAAQVAEAAGVPLLAPSTFDSAAISPYWAFSLAADDTDALAAIVADAYRENRPTLALMALSGPIGQQAETDLHALLAVIGGRLTFEHMYPPDVSELRPEALVAASTQPGGVVVWGLTTDLLVAHDALRRRGYEGNVYFRTALLAPGFSPLPWARLLNARVAVPPAAAPVPAHQLSGVQGAFDAATPRHGTWGSAGACAVAGRRDADRLAAVPGASANAVAAAPFLAALDLLERGLEQLIALQIPSSDPLVLRQALRDALVGLPATCTGAGLLDLRDGLANAVDPAGLGIAGITNRGLEPLP